MTALDQQRTAVQAALADRDLARLRSLAAQEGGFVDRELRQAIWPFLLGLDRSELDAGRDAAGDDLRASDDRPLPPAYAPPAAEDDAGAPLPPSAAPTPAASSSSSDSSSRPSSPSTSFIEPPSSLNDSVTSLSFASPSASLAFLPPAPAPASSSSSSSSSPASPSRSRATSDACSVSELSWGRQREAGPVPLLPPPPPPMDWGLFAGLGADALAHHVDEGQIKLDTRRSFVVYPPVSQRERERLQLQLHAMLLTVFRRHPTLRYFQGYHDIASVFLLTYLPLPALLATPPSPPPPSSTPISSASSSSRHRSRSGSRTREASAHGALGPEQAAQIGKQVRVVTACLERLSLYRIRDGMGLGLEPVMGLLRVMSRVLKAADPELAKIVARATPLPFFALSWLLTLFSHDVDSEPIIQLLFDFLLSHNPVMAVYLTCSIVLSKRALIHGLKPNLRDDPGLLHSTLSSLPVFLPGATSPHPPPKRTPSQDHLPDEILNQPPLPLPLLFAGAEALYARFPPSSAEVRVADFMGARSVVLTYEEEQAGRPISQQEAERVVGELEAMVNVDPPIDPPFSDSEDDEDDGRFEKSEKRRRSGRKKAAASPLGLALPAVSWPTVVAVTLFAGAVSVAVFNTAATSRAGGGGTGGGAGWADGGRRLGELAGVGGLVADTFFGGAGGRA